jgi:ATP-dependent helicase Lhr and Lhr-like helicase
LVTNDTIEALREVVRWRELPVSNPQDPTRWLPADYTPSPDRRVVQRRPNLRRLPKWRRPDRPGGISSGSWAGRWSLIQRQSTLGPPLPEEEKALLIARQWLDRYGIVTRDWWKRERPSVSWRSIYQELKKLEFRGEARRGYFVRGLAGAQFAAPAAVELLRAAASEDPSSTPFVVLSASDPANVYNLALDLSLRDPLSRPRGSGAVLVTRAGRVAISVEGRGRRVTIADWMTQEEVGKAKEILSQHLRGEKGARYLMLPDIRPT